MDNTNDTYTSTSEKSPQKPLQSPGSPLLSDAGFHATPLAPTLPPPSNGDPSFITNSLSLQRNPSAAKDKADLLARKLSTKSVHSTKSADSKRLSTGSGRLASRLPEVEERGKSRGDSNSSLVDATNDCNLSHSDSNKSVRSVQAVGNFPLGTLRVHSPSPVRPGSEPEHECLQDGDVFIARGVPAGAILGYDTHVLTISARDQFEGIKDIPAGVHLIWGGSGLTSLRNGFWFISSKPATDVYGEIHVRRWDVQNEVLSEQISQAEVRIQKSELPEILHKMQSYPTTPIAPPTKSDVDGPSSPAAAKDPNTWSQLTSCIKGSLLSKVTGQQWNHWQVSSYHDVNPHGHKTPASRDADITIDNYKDDVLNFVFPKETRTFSDASRGRQRTEQALDSTSYIEDIINENCTYKDSDEIIGEVQFCYLTGMLLGNIACMEQWAHIVKTVFHAYFLSLEMPTFFTKFIQAIHNQFRYDHDYLDGSILDHDNNLTHDLKVALTVFKSRLNEQLLAHGASLSGDQHALAKAFEKFEEWLWKWDWDLRGNYVRTGKIQ